MKIEKSPLILKDFIVIDSKYEFLEPDSDIDDIKDVMDQYEIDFDFMLKKEEGDVSFLYTKISINDTKNSLPGYRMFVEGLSIFDFNPKAKLSKKEKADFLYLSGLSIAINNLRTYLCDVTSYYPFGKFLLPAIDVGALHNEKRKQMESKKKK